MNVKAKAGKKLLINKRNEYRLNLQLCEDNSPVLVLAHVNTVDGNEEFSPIAELNMAGIFEQVFNVINAA